MRQRGRTWRHTVRDQLTHHKGLAPKELEKALMSDLKAESKQCDIEGHRIHWLEAGDGPPQVLLHGWTCSGFFWKPMFPRLETSFRILAPDLPGHGLSSKKEASYLPEVQATRMLDWLTAIGEVGEQYARLLPHACLARVSGTGHMLPWEEPDFMASKILEFSEKGCRSS